MTACYSRYRPAKYPLNILGFILLSKTKWSRLSWNYWGYFTGEGTSQQENLGLKAWKRGQGASVWSWMSQELQGVWLGGCSTPAEEEGLPQACLNLSVFTWSGETCECLTLVKIISKPKNLVSLCEYCFHFLELLERTLFNCFMLGFCYCCFSQNNYKSKVKREYTTLERGDHVAVPGEFWTWSVLRVLCHGAWVGAWPPLLLHSFSVGINNTCIRSVGVVVFTLLVGKSFLK